MRTILSAVLIVLVALLVPASAVAYWADRELGDADRYTAAMSPLARNPAVREVVVTQTTRALAGQIDAGPFQSGVDALLGEALGSFADTPAYRTAWDAANRAAHAAFLEALTTGHGDALTIDIAPVIAQVKGELVADGVPFADRIPVTHLSVKVMEYDNLGALRKGFHMLQIAGVWLPVLTLVLAAAAIAVAVHRRRAVIATGLGLAVGAVLLWIAVGVCRGLTLDDLPADIDRPAAEAVYDALTAFLRTTAWVVLAVGLAAALVAWLTGRLRRTP
uniref:Integral membrane protein n=1 Tax=Streptomyces sp. NBC_00049 TaxID=2903617 RepID=A0AAU2JQC0_9ACTN